MTELTNQSCAACDGQVPALTDDQITVFLAELDTGWVYDSNTQTLTREFVFKGFAKAVYMANLVAFISDKEGHHADIQFGWGYCRVIYTSHELGRLSENDFICAAKLDAML